QGRARSRAAVSHRIDGAAHPEPARARGDAGPPRRVRPRCRLPEGLSASHQRRHDRGRPRRRRALHGPGPPRRRPGRRRVTHRRRRRSPRADRRRMRLFRRKLWGDRVTWLFVLVATVFVVNQYTARHTQSRLYILYGWTIVVTWLIFFSELRIGRKKPEPDPRALYTGWAAFVGEDRIDPSGERHRGWSGTAPGVLSFDPSGLRWSPLIPDQGPEEMFFQWQDVFSWRLIGVIPFVGRASGYLWVSFFGGRELVFHVHAIR